MAHDSDNDGGRRHEDNSGNNRASRKSGYPANAVSRRAASPEPRAEANEQAGHSNEQPTRWHLGFG